MKVSNLRPTSSNRPAAGYGLMIFSDGNQEACGFLDGSPVLVPTAIEKDGDRRRFRFSEGSRQLRSLGDVFCPDVETAALVCQALNEKMERDSDSANAFRVCDTRASRRGAYAFLSVSIRYVQSGSFELLKFTLEAPDCEVQEDGQREFSRFVDALGLAEVDDPTQLHGLTATHKGSGEQRVFKRWSAA